MADDVEGPPPAKGAQSAWAAAGSDLAVGGFGCYLAPFDANSDAEDAFPQRGVSQKSWQDPQPSPVSLAGAFLSASSSAPPQPSPYASPRIAEDASSMYTSEGGNGWSAAFGALASPTASPPAARASSMSPESSPPAARLPTPVPGSSAFAAVRRSSTMPAEGSSLAGRASSMSPESSPPAARASSMSPASLLPGARESSISPENYVPETQESSMPPDFCLPVGRVSSTSPEMIPEEGPMTQAGRGIRAASSFEPLPEAEVACSTSLEPSSHAEDDESLLEESTQPEIDALRALSSRQEGSAIEADRDRFQSQLSDDSFDEEDEYDDARLLSPQSFSGGRSGRHVDTGGFQDFIDEVSDGIGSYLASLAEKGKGVRYDRYSLKNGPRWRELIRKTCEQATEASPPKRAQGRWPHGMPPEGGMPLPGLTPNLGPCAPPTDAVFEEPEGNADSVPGRQLQFSSCFESGNLAFAKSETPQLYILLLDFDVNTCGYTQWFYFGVRNGVKGQTVTFKLTNMSKAKSLFEQGYMKPVVWSEKAGRGWERGCTGVQYYPNSQKRNVASGKAGEGGSTYRTLEFSYTFEHQDDTVFFAYHYPYTYSYLREFLDELCKNPKCKKLIKRQTLCQSVAGVPCEVLEVTDPRANAVVQPGCARPVAVVTARVHPGEANSSWMMQGFLQFICSSLPEAKALRADCVWIIIPMLCPDGVIYGNYRCGLAGVDMNRVFSRPHKRLHPEIYGLKEYLKGRQVHIYLDFHGHSKKEGIFLYGGHSAGAERNAHIRLLPKLCGVASTDFKYKGCDFSVTDSKRTTARLVAFLEFGVIQAYTVEASFHSAGQSEFQSDMGETVSDSEESSGIAGRRVSLRSTAARALNTVAGTAPAIPVVRRPRGPSKGGGVKEAVSELAKQVAVTAPPRSPGFRRVRNSVESVVHTTTRLSGSELEGILSSDEELVEEDRWSRSDGLSDGATEQGDPVSLHSLEAVAPLRPPQPRDDFVPSRLETAGPTIGKAVAACWMLQKGMQIHPPETDDDGYLDGYDDAFWSHMRGNQLTLGNVKAHFSRLMNGNQSEGLEDDGSDSDPSGDEKNAEDLRRIHFRLLKTIKRRELSRRHRPHAEPAAQNVQYRTVVAFGKVLRIPITDKSSVHAPTLQKEGQAAAKSRWQKASKIAAIASLRRGSTVEEEAKEADTSEQKTNKSEAAPKKERVPMRRRSLVESPVARDAGPSRSPLSPRRSSHAGISTYRRPSITSIGRGPGASPTSPKSPSEGQSAVERAAPAASRAPSASEEVSEEVPSVSESISVSEAPAASGAPAARALPPPAEESPAVRDVGRRLYEMAANQIERSREEHMQRKASAGYERRPQPINCLREVVLDMGEERKTEHSDCPSSPGSLADDTEYCRRDSAWSLQLSLPGQLVVGKLSSNGPPGACAVEERRTERTTLDKEALLPSHLLPTTGRKYMKEQLRQSHALSSTQQQIQQRLEQMRKLPGPLVPANDKVRQPASKQRKRTEPPPRKTNLQAAAGNACATLLFKPPRNHRPQSALGPIPAPLGGRSTPVQVPNSPRRRLPANAQAPAGSPRTARSCTPASPEPPLLLQISDASTQRAATPICTPVRVMFAGKRAQTPDEGWKRAALAEWRASPGWESAATPHRPDSRLSGAVSRGSTAQGHYKGGLLCS
eukprot:TRINITY_DN41709_c0_g1_i1.p1 TRINITY_DN41709_c0_g1~~TRINITY_DN41709_c0_g1_i1.p1  ORF type:complete len:1670 (+),score=248.12 TRINITY_DN41709_c0_g1_i1:174-5183(+)